MNDLKTTKLKTIPNSNLTERKRQVLKIHQDNLRMVKRLSDMKTQQAILIPEDPQQA